MKTSTDTAALLDLVTMQGNMDRDDLDADLLAVAISDGLVVDVHGFIYAATSRHARYA